MLSKSYWESKFRHPDWYIKLAQEIKFLFVSSLNKEERRRVVNLTAKLLKEGKIALGKRGPNFDENRIKVDTVIIHHTGSRIKSLEYLSALGLLRLYALDYLGNKGLGHQIYGAPIWSGHFLNGKQVFFPYHWVMFEDGRTKRLLDDKYIGWHAGNWKINKRSVGIALSGDFELHSPTVGYIKRLIKLISKNYPNIKKNRILLHCDIVKTACPGTGFISQWEKVSEEKGRKS